MGEPTSRFRKGAQSCECAIDKGVNVRLGQAHAISVVTSISFMYCSKVGNVGGGSPDSLSLAAVAEDAIVAGNWLVNAAHALNAGVGGAHAVVIARSRRRRLAQGQKLVLGVGLPRSGSETMHAFWTCQGLPSRHSCCCNDNDVKTTKMTPTKRPSDLCFVGRYSRLEDGSAGLVNLANCKRYRLSTGRFIFIGMQKAKHAKKENRRWGKDCGRCVYMHMCAFSF